MRKSKSRWKRRGEETGEISHRRYPVYGEHLLFLLLLSGIVCWGGGANRWAQTAFLGGIVVLYRAALPVETPGKLFNGLFGILSIVPLFSFLPPVLSAMTWRKELQEMGVGNIAVFVTPQPWVTLDILPLYYGGLALLWWILCQNPDNEQRRKLVTFFAILGSALTVFSLLAWKGHWNIPSWPHDGTLGPFRSRNQMATLLAVQSVFLLSLVHSAWHRRQTSWPFWAIALCVTSAAIILNYSRAGILLFCFGILFYGTLLALSRKKIAIFAACLSVLFLFIAFFFAGGGKTLARFLGPNIRNFDVTQDFRFLVQKDAWRMISENFLFGTGLGNFNAVFPLYRSVSHWEFRTWHPESDWLWLAADLGVPALLAAMGIACAIAVRLLKSADQPVSVIRIGGIVACGQFLLHSWFDISGHEPGTFLVLCFALLLCWPGPQGTFGNRGISVAIMILVACLGLGWGIGLLVPFLRIGMYREAWLMHRAEIFRSEGNYTKAESCLEQATHQVPLSDEVRYLHARTILAAGGSKDHAGREFELAARLEPFSPVTEEDAARDWLHYDPSRAPAPFIRALERSTPRQLRMGRYELYLKESRLHPEAFDLLLKYGLIDADLAVIRLGYVQESNFPGELAAFTRDHGKNLDTLTAPRFFQTVESRAGMEGLKMTENLPGGWIILAEEYAKSGDFQNACVVAFRHESLSKHVSNTSRDKETLYRQWKENPSDDISGLSLIPMVSFPEDSIIIKELAQKFRDRHDVPLSLYFLSARVDAQNKDWELAWRDLEIYLKGK